MVSIRVPVARRNERSFPPVLPSRAELVPFESAVLADNPLHDPARREVAVLRPPSGRTEGTPLLLLLSGYAGTGPGEMARRDAFAENLFQLFDRMVRSGACGEATLVAPDCYTSLGGNQYLNSSAMGRYDDHLVRELLPWAQERYRTGPVGVLGQSSGGFGALHLAFEHPGQFAAVGSSAGDMGFEYAYLADLAKACREFQKHGGPQPFLEHLFDEPMVLRGPTHSSGAALITLGMAASYSPIDRDPGAFELPCDWETAELDPRVWARWKAFDPVARAATDAGAAALRQTKLLIVTGSRDDEWYLDQGSRWFSAVARRQRIPVVHEEFDGGHFQRRPRFEAIFARMVAALRA
jgi:pimeloyl-ACP methyl ester carboxylesterase